MKVIITTVNGRIEQVEKHKNDTKTMEEYKKMTEDLEKGVIPSNYMFSLRDLSVFEDD